MLHNIRSSFITLDSKSVQTTYKDSDSHPTSGKNTPTSKPNNNGVSKTTETFSNNIDGQVSALPSQNYANSSTKERKFPITLYMVYNFQ